MVKTQVQIPEKLYDEAKRIASEYEMSFAEVVRRGLEFVIPCYPPKGGRDLSGPPQPQRLGWKGLSLDELKDAAQMTSLEERLSRKK